MNTERALILVVDDVTKNIQILGNFLREADYDIAVATSGMQALAVLEHVTPELILLDIMMPGMDGFEACRRIKERDDTQDIPVVFVTAKTDIDDIVRGFELGAVDYITKPFNRLELLARVKTHVDLRRSRRDLIKALGDKDKFFSIIAHDLRGPLGSFMSIAEFLSDNVGELDWEEILPLLSEMRNTGRGVYRLLENLLEWSRIQLGTITFSPESRSFREIVEMVEAVLQTQASRKDIVLAFVGELDVTVVADMHMISTVLRNLVGNAIKYTPRGGSVTVALIPAGDRFEISVHDSGVGMEQATVDSLFDISKVRTTPGTDKEKGTGLGLILCRELIAKHGQQLTVESTPGVGSVFSFKLPRA